MRGIHFLKTGGRRLFVLMLAAALLFGGIAPTTVNAHAFDNACAYYNENGNSVKFWKVNEKDGEICYATSAKIASTNIRYKTLGWKVSVRDMSGKKLQNIYFKLGGSYMKRVDSRQKSGYEYNLYALMLSSLKKRMNEKAKQALEEGNCTMTVDACMTVVRGNDIKGGMDDNGNFTGKVYTDYDGIAGAENWNAAAANSLKSYFDKEVKGLFYDIKVKKSTGIKAVTGSGHYLYGTKLTASAEVKKGYTFEGWTGIKSCDSIDCTFYVNDAGTLTAEASPIQIQIVYHRNLSAADTMLVLQTAVYGQKDKRMRKENWTKDGKSPVGYALSQGAVEASYALDAKITDGWILKYAPQVHLFAVWPGEEEEEDKIILPPGETPDDSDPDPDDSDFDDSDPDPDNPDPDDPDPEPKDPDDPDDSDPDDPDPDEPDEPEDPDPGPDEPEPDIPEPTPPSNNDLPTVAPIRMRFISKKYFEDAAGLLVAESRGGLSTGSRWALDLSLRSLLRSVLMRAETA
ncbi:MAG: hypothetical protein NC180_10015 [Muribaculaceae bacterium]|nr:hypothetical protein [Roseburia sp.]MCM1431935.1 hypothetical protein [Muribaculaceae bacterium]MCM1493545.1 hypothetical protein [Muribaculaceae bacterium]